MTPKRKSNLPKIRKTWGNLRPVTKIKQSKKVYKRNNWNDLIDL